MSCSVSVPEAVSFLKSFLLVKLHDQILQTIFNLILSTPASEKTLYVIMP